MKKAVFSLLFLLAFISLSTAQTINVEKTEITPVIIADVGNPLEYMLEITNNGISDSFEISSTAGFTIEPSRSIEISSGETVTIRIRAYASNHRLETNRGEFVFEYQINALNSGETFKDKFRVEILELNKVLSAKIDNLNPESSEATITITNLKRIALEDISAEIDSPFFEGTHFLTLEPFAKSSFPLQIDEDKKNRLVAGDYNADISLRYNDSRAVLEVPFKYLEKEGVASTQESEGFIVRSTNIQKTNIGNTPVSVSASEKVDILSRLFTTFSVKPDSSEKEGFSVRYNWERELNPGDKLTIEIKTNYTLPFVLIILVLGVVLGVKLYLETNLKIKKNVTLVKTKGDELALRVRLTAKARKNLKDIKITDRIPTVTKLYDKFGIKPTHIDAHSRTLGWDLKSLNAGEERVFSYIIYSKIKIVGRFELPAARATYEFDDKKQEVYSNKTAFVAETAESESKKDIF